MFKYGVFVVLALVLVPSLASAQQAQLPTQTEIDSAYEFCDTRFVGTASAMILARDACKRGVDIKVLKRQQEAGEQGTEAKLVELQKQLETITQQLAEEKKPKPAPSSEPSPQPPQPTRGPSLPAFVGGVPFGVIDTPGQFAATTWNVPTPWRGRSPSRRTAS